MSFKLIPSRILILCILTPLSGQAKDYRSKEFLAKVEKFEHIHPGCPMNSICNAQMGLRMKKWRKALKGDSKALERFRKKSGILVDIWSSAQLPATFDALWWDSPCPHHKKNPVWRQGKAFVQELTNSQAKIVLNNGKIHQQKIGADFQLTPIYILINSKKIVKYLVPRGTIPLAIKNQKIESIMGDTGPYYALQISPQGSWKVIPTKFNNSDHDKVECPSQLKKMFKKDLLSFPSYSQIYRYSFCKKIYNKKTKNYHTILVPGSCS